MHIVRRKGAPEAGHPFLDHPWCASDSDRGIAWGVLTTPRMKYLVGEVRGERVEEEIGCSVRYGASRAPKTTFPGQNSPPRPALRPGAGCILAFPHP